jgi:hypothetical protein
MVRSSLNTISLNSSSMLTFGEGRNHTAMLPVKPGHYYCAVTRNSSYIAR